MKKCKYCKSEIDNKAKICPNCKKKQGPHIVRWVILGIIAIAIIGAIAGGGSKDDFQKEYSQNETVNYKDVAYTITKVEKTKGSNKYFQAKEIILNRRIMT